MQINIKTVFLQVTRAPDGDPRPNSSGPDEPRSDYSNNDHMICLTFRTHLGIVVDIRVPPADRGLLQDERLWRLVVDRRQCRDLVEDVIGTGRMNQV